MWFCIYPDGDRTFSCTDSLADIHTQTNTDVAVMGSWQNHHYCDLFIPQIRQLITLRIVFYIKVSLHALSIKLLTMRRTATVDLESIYSSTQVILPVRQKRQENTECLSQYTTYICQNAVLLPSGVVHK